MLNCFNGKNVVLGISGGIAVYKSVELLRAMQKQGACVKVIMTKSALEFVGEVTFKSLSGYPVYTDLFGEKEASIKHIDLAQEADIVVVAPATANIIGKFANGIADDALSTFLLAVKSPVIICPAMNTNMYDNRAVQKNLDTLENYGCSIVEPGTGQLACGTVGAGRFPEIDYIMDRIANHLTPKDLKGKSILVTAGPTRESIDPVRFISNHSSGKMGYAVARAAEYRGANVTLISGSVNIAPPFNLNVINVVSAKQMADAVFEYMDVNDVIIKVAAVADYRPKEISKHKIKKKKDDFILELEENPDILKELGKRKNKQILVGFAAETQDLENNAAKKLQAKNLDMIIGNLVGDPLSGFGTDTNIVTLFYKDGTKEPFESMAKEMVANIILDRIKQIIENG